MPPMRVKRGAIATLVLVLIGFAVSVEIGLVHRALTDGFTSWCDVNETVTCYAVLSSEYAHLFGVPVAWWAGLTYLLCAALAVVVLATERATPRRRAAALLFAVSAWSLVFSVYMAVVALAVIHAVCLLCSGLYLVNACLFVAAWVVFAATRVAGRAGERAWEAWQQRTKLLSAGVGLAMLAFVALAAWETTGGGSSLTAEEIAKQHPEFYRRWQALPVAKPEELPPVPAPSTPHGAPVVIIEFSDFQCPSCAQAFRNLKRVLPRFGDQVQVAFHHFPLDKACNPAVVGDMHRFACLAAMAEECAAAQGRAWQYQDILFAHQSALDRNSLIEYADRVGLDRGRFLACLDSDEPRRAVERDVRAGAQLRVERTPTLFIDGRRVEGALEPDNFYYAIRLAQAARQSGQ